MGDTEASEIENDLHPMKILRDQIRMEIILHLLQYPYLSFQNMVKITDRSKSTISYHLKLLQDADLIQEVEPEERHHKMTKYYSLSDKFRGLQAPPEAKDEKQREEVVETFEYGRFYYRFISNLLNRVVDYSDDAYNVASENIKNFDDVNTQVLFDEMIEIIGLSKFVALPLSKSEYIEFTKGLEEYIIKFLGNMKKTDSKDNGQYWITAAALPLGLIKQSRTRLETL